MHHKTAEFDLRLGLPNHALFVGATQSGKTRLCLYLLSQTRLFVPKPRRILFFYEQWQEAYEMVKKELTDQGIDVQFFDEFSADSIASIDKSDGQTILVVDDYSEETSASKEVAKIATNGRHKNISLWLIWHSLFTKYPASRLIVQNVRWFFFLPSLRLESQLRIFGSQLCMKNEIISAYKSCSDDCSNQFRYLLLDAGPETPTILRLRTNVDSLYQHCFVSNKKL